VKRPTVGLIVFVLAIGLTAMIVLLMLGVVIIALTKGNPANPLLGARSAQVLSNAVAGIVGIIGSYVGYHLRDHDDDQ